MSSTVPPLLDIRDLSVEFTLPQGSALAVNALNLTVQAGKTLVLLGESGSGKSVTALSIMGLLPPAATIISGSICLKGDDLTRYSNAAMRTIRGVRIGMVFQEPMTSLNPVMTVGKQIIEALPGGRKQRAYKAARARGIELLSQMGIPEPERRFDEFPHQLSGGMKQRVMIAIALAGEPDLLIADEPTTALDVTTQAQILKLLRDLQRQHDMALLLVTHDFGIAAEMADQVAVMRHGQIVESATAAEFFRAPQHPYSKQLFAALPSMNKRGQALTGTSTQAQIAATAEVSAVAETPSNSKPLLKVSGLQVLFKQRPNGLFQKREHLYAVDGVSLTLKPGETLAIVGESGCGKSTVIKSLLQLLRPDSGSVLFNDVEMTRLTQRQLRPHRRHLQVVFQDPYSSLNPRMRVSDIIQEGMIAQKIGGNRQQRETRVDQLLGDVGLDLAAKDRYPHEFSGGQRQRIGIARALAVDPEILFLDEPTSALDLSVQAQILDLLGKLRRQHGLAYVFVTHDLSVVEYFADRVAVMYLGRIVEEGSVVEVMTKPAHPYTRALLASIPLIAVNTAGVRENTGLTNLKGEPPSASRRPAGCHFHPRCPIAQPRCQTDYPPPVELAAGHQVNCHYPLQQDSDNNRLGC
ncbi:MAG: dipeptide ABC transporter ATP-binding protein [Immundisolibacteraceae bacterium]|nr:dipeptide ABC transporter ATP-binding protein [Immundisolibacteraceae bacterium]